MSIGDRYIFGEFQVRIMAGYTKDRLASILVRHGYPTINMTPQWYQFALQLATIEKLDKILEELKNRE